MAALPFHARASARTLPQPGCRQPFLLALVSCLVLSLSACTTVRPVEAGASTLTFVVVRHAEKDIDEGRDPALSGKGEARAQHLASLLSRAPLVAAYATGYRRTQQTATPAAEAHHLRVTTYDAQSPASEFATQLRAAHARGTVLVVGHSNTVPEIVAALSGKPVEAMADDQYGLLYRVTIAADGNATLSQDRY